MIHQGVLSRQGTEFGRPCHFTGKAPPFSSEPRTKTANSSQVSPEKCQKSAEISGIGAIAPLPCCLHLHDVNRHLIKGQDSDEDLVSSASVFGRDSASVFVILLPLSCSANDEAFAVYLDHCWDHLI
jgi:hypothetical protein